jgi:hypothetical protein
MDKAQIKVAPLTTLCPLIEECSKLREMISEQQVILDKLETEEDMMKLKLGEVEI